MPDTPTLPPTPCDVCRRQKKEHRLWDFHGIVLDLCDGCAEAVPALADMDPAGVMSMLQRFVKSLVRLYHWERTHQRTLDAKRRMSRQKRHARANAREFRRRQCVSEALRERKAAMKAARDEEKP